MATSFLGTQKFVSAPGVNLFLHGSDARESISDGYKERRSQDLPSATGVRSA